MTFWAYFFYQMSKFNIIKLLCDNNNIISYIYRGLLVQNRNSDIGQRPVKRKSLKLRS